ncbi:50S ribosomal protein L35 [Patescibacteria group bacterium]|nr:50S ribosomal protein L35 [Patescibacteria group bacterium]MBU4082739.1 50S ribosomal protein L35 [Patescibacteria group bacterium]MCG2809658.1 50S ribosomal protein L35 [Candidatus Portnoybacteria bacterium]
MTKFKTRKALLKRIKITGSGKFMKRPTHQDHLNSKESGNKTRSKRKATGVSSDNRKVIKEVFSNI